MTIPYLGVEVEGSKNVIIAIEAQAINARNLAISVVIIQHQDEECCATTGHEAAEAVPNLHRTAQVTIRCSSIAAAMQLRATLEGTHRQDGQLLYNSILVRLCVLLAFCTMGIER